MLHSIYKKLKKQKILLLTTSFLALPALIVSCTDPHQESPKNISKSPTPGQGSTNPGNNNPVEGNNPKSADPQKGSPILEDNSDIITNSVLGFNGQKKNPKVAKNTFDVTKNYTEVIPKASFILDNGGTGKYGLLPYWYYLQSIPKYLEKNNYIINNKYNKEEYLKRLKYFDAEIKDYWLRNLVDYKSPQDGGAVEVWRQGLINQYTKFVAANDKEKKENIKLPEDLGNNDKVDPKTIKKDEYFSIIKPELDKYNAQIPEEMKYNVVFDFLLGNQRIWPSSVDNVVYGGEAELDEARLFRDDLYIEKGYKPSQPERLWYELGWFMLRPQRIISASSVARTVLENIGDIEKNLFDLTNKNESIDKQLKTGAIRNFIKQLANFLSPKHHLSLRKDLIFNIDISNNADDQSLISDFIEYYNQKISPLIWRYNSEQQNTALKITPLTKNLKDLKDLKEDMFFYKYLKDYLPEIKELTDEEDIKNDKTLTEEQKKEATDKAKKAGIKAWSQWLKTYQQNYGIQFKEDSETDGSRGDHESLSSVTKPDPSQSTSPSDTQEAQEETQETDAQPTN
ncbi:hypothetical protein [Mesomycoplasma ovipneumoniae]|uniref:hypothetical protein n=1 Tax=Mesomycoplasma ovipneumoniae TaxID=29562 RepID=UPI00083E953E|nr:hypothetical protein [Mesomycoplasma ovipneumoniae]